MRIKKLLAVGVIAAAAFSSTGAVGHQTSGTDPRGDKCGGAGLQTAETPAGTLYVDVRNVGDTPEEAGAFSVWVYLESNDHEGMQTKAGTPGDVLGDINGGGFNSVEDCTTGGGHSPTTTTTDTLIF